MSCLCCCKRRKLKLSEGDDRFVDLVSHNTQQHTMSAGDLAQLVARLEKVTDRLEKTSVGGGAPAAASAGPAGEDSVSVTDYDKITSGPLVDFITASGKIGGLVNEQAALLKAAMTAQRAYLVNASQSKKPSSQGDIVQLLQPTSEKITAILELKEKNRRSEFFNHLAALAEGVSALAWVTIEPTPAPYVKEMADAGMFYVNRVLKEYKEKGQMHSDWTKSLCALWRELQAYVKQHHTTGLVWNPAGGDAMKAQAAAPAAPAGGAPPPPPPIGNLPPPPPPAASSSSPAAPDTGALFAELNKGSAITSGLKKVSADMQTHKNPALRTGPAPFKPPVATKPGAVRAPTAVAKPVQKPPLVELQGKKWAVENLTNNTNTVIEDTNPKQTVYVYKCVNSTIQVKGKINSITLDGCKKTAIVVDEAISMIEFINCQSVKCQVLGKVPTVSIEKTDGCQVYLSKDSLETSFISAKSSEMNVAVPSGPDGDYKEYAIAEQFRTVFNGKTLVTEVNDIAA